MSFASSSRSIIRSISRIPRQQQQVVQIGRRSLLEFAQQRSPILHQTFQSSRWPAISISHYSTPAFANAKPLNHSVKSSTSTISTSSQEGKRSESSSSSGESEQPDPDEPPKKASIRERLRFLTRRYGWWALGVYIMASTIDFSLIFLAIHLLGADHIRELEDAVRDYFGMGKRQMEDHEVAAWPVPASVIASGGEQSDGTLANNEKAAEKAARRVKTQTDISISSEEERTAKNKHSGGGHSNSSTLWTEAVLAYTIHKTLFLPFRVAFTAAVTPTFVKYMVRLGWAKNNAAVQQAAQKAKMAKDAAKKAMEKAK